MKIGKCDGYEKVGTNGFPCILEKRHKGTCLSAPLQVVKPEVNMSAMRKQAAKAEGISKAEINPFKINMLNSMKCMTSPLHHIAHIS